MKKTTENSEGTSKKNGNSSINKQAKKTRDNLASIMKDYPDDFTSKRSSDFANSLIKNNQLLYLVNNLSDFSGLSNDIAYQLIDLGHGSAVAENIESFCRIEGDFDTFLWVDKEHEEIAKKLIDAGYVKDVIDNLYHFNGIDHNIIAFYLISNGYGKDVAENILKFNEPEPFSHKKIVDTLIDLGFGDILLSNIKYCEGLDLETRDKFLEKGFLDKIKHLSNCFDNFYLNDENKKKEKMMNKIFRGGKYRPNLDEAFDIINEGNIRFVLENLDKFDIDHNELAKKLIDRNYLPDFILYFKKFEGLDRNVAVYLIENGYLKEVMGNLRSFTGLDKDVADLIISKDYTYWYSILRNKERIFNISKESLKGDNVLSILLRYDEKYIRWPEELAYKLIEIGQIGLLADALGNFNLLSKDIAFKLIDAGFGTKVIEYIRKFDSNDEDFVFSHTDNAHLEIAKKLIDAGLKDELRRDIDCFKILERDELIK